MQAYNLAGTDEFDFLAFSSKSRKICLSILFYNEEGRL